MVFVKCFQFFKFNLTRLHIKQKEYDKHVSALQERERVRATDSDRGKRCTDYSRIIFFCYWILHISHRKHVKSRYSTPNQTINKTLFDVIFCMNFYKSIRHFISKIRLNFLQSNNLFYFSFVFLVLSNDESPFPPGEACPPQKFMRLLHTDNY